MKDITIVIKTLDRYNCLKPLIKSIIKRYDNVPRLIGDDSKVSCKKQVEKDVKNNKNMKIYGVP